MIAVDIGNSRMKIGRFQPRSKKDIRLPEPVDSFELPIIDRSGEFDVAGLCTWFDGHVPEQATWWLASVHRGAASRLTAAITKWSASTRLAGPVRILGYRDVPLAIHVDAPERVGIDRLLGALAANRLRCPGRPAIVVDLGTAITVDLVDAEGAFAGGAILPGIALSARALAEGADALPLVEFDRLERAPLALGKSTAAAIKAGLYWGTLGAVRELAAALSADLAMPPELFLTGGGSQQFEVLLSNMDGTVRQVPHLVLAGIALVGSPPPAVLPEAQC